MSAMMGTRIRHGTVAARNQEHKQAQLIHAQSLIAQKQVHVYSPPATITVTSAVLGASIIKLHMKVTE